MRVEFTEVVKTVKELQEFLKKFPEDAKWSAIDALTFEGHSQVSIAFESDKIYAVECGDHVPKSGEQYPKDVLVELHKCND